MFWFFWFRIELIVIEVLFVWWLLMISLCWLWLIGISVLIVLIFVWSGLWMDLWFIMSGVGFLIGCVLFVRIGLSLFIGWFNGFIIWLISFLLIGIFMMWFVFFILFFLWILLKGFKMMIFMFDFLRFWVIFKILFENLISLLVI